MNGWNYERATQWMLQQGFTCIDTQVKSSSFAVPGKEERQITIPHERVDVVSAYINRNSTDGKPYPKDGINGVKSSKEYLMGHRGKNGSLGIARTVNKNPSLKPATNNVLCIHLNNESALAQLMSWYRGNEGAIAEEKNEAAPVGEGNYGALKNSLNSAMDDMQDIPAINDSTYSPAGYEIDPIIRRIIEKYAVCQAINHYETAGFTVTEFGKPFDLLCKRGDLTVHVEVKGTRSNGDAVELTINEIDDARNPSWRSDLFIVSRIVLTGAGEGSEASGGDIHHVENWIPDNEDLNPIRFRYRAPKK